MSAIDQPARCELLTLSVVIQLFVRRYDEDLTQKWAWPLSSSAARSSSGMLAH